VELREHPEWPLSDRHRNPVTVTLADGTELSESMPAHLGSRANPLTPTAIEAKFRTCAARTLASDAVDAPVAALQAIQSAPSVRRALDLVTLDAGV
jgi:hypothetical protein